MAVINTNISALAAQGSLSNVTKKQQTAMERLSTGLRINSAKDDAAGLAITNRMTSQIRGYAVAIRNSNDGISMAQTAEGALGQIGDILQRMRELAVQSSNGTNSAQNRQAIQSEISQLKDEINNIATKTNHNDIKLLDGSSGNIVLQTGVNEHDTMTMKFESAKAKDLGVGAPAALTSIGQTFSATSANEIAEGDLKINNVGVGTSLATSDSLSYSANSSSAIAKVAAINLVSGSSKVVASVNENQVYGSTMATSTNSTTGTITINGVATSSMVIQSSANTSVVRGMVVDSINFMTSQTGVTAIDGGDDAHGVILKAADGRNITIAFGTSMSAGVTGLNSAGTYIGTYTLSSTDGSPINISSEVGGEISASGLTAGIYDANVAQVVTAKRAAVGSGSALTALDGNDLILNGVAVGAAVSTDDTSTFETTSATKRSSAIATAAAINKVKDLTGVTAKANSNILVGTGFAGIAADGLSAGFATMTLNGVTVSVSMSTSTTRQNVVDAINLVKGQTGVVASDNGDGLTLVAEDGRTITVGAQNALGSAATAAASFGLSTVNGDSFTITSGGTGVVKAFVSSVSLISDAQFTVASGSWGNSDFATLGFTSGTFGGSKDSLKVAALDVSTVSGAMVAITALDRAIEQISLQQSRTGAYQNRLDSVVSNLNESNQNMSASRSRILDTDYANETTNLAKSQIISQAATAMLAQANQSGQSVLALLK